jgi:NADH-quinone oxidoreductase subunit E
MAVRRVAEQQPDSFAFSAENVAWAEKEIAKYPEGRQASAVISLLWRAQEQEGWVSEPAIRAVAEMLGMARIRVLEVATFYTMFHLEPVGDIAHIQVCRTTPCWLRGSEGLSDICRKRIHPEQNHRSADGAFSWEEVECLGACVNAPMIQIVPDTYEDLTPESFEQLIDDLAARKAVKPGPQIDRQYSAPVGGATTLTDPAIYETRPPAPGLSAQEQAPTVDAAPAPAQKPAPETAAPSNEGKPDGLVEPRCGKADDLKRISGVGPKIEKMLNGLGIFHYDQIAGWTDTTVSWVDDHLSFKGRINRENWIEQAKVLAEGHDTEFSRRADAGAGKE